MLCACDNWLKSFEPRSEERLDIALLVEN
jgi:hypothetical protein